MTDTLKSICEQCASLHDPRLDFIPERFSRRKEIILRDLKELVAAASSECEKTIVVLGGSILEAVLYSFLESQETYIAKRRGVFTFNPDHSLENYVSTFNRWFRDVLPGVGLPDSVVDDRNLIHINRELKKPPESCLQGARTMLRILDVLLDQLARFAEPSGQ